MKIRLTGATFTAAAKTVTHASFSDITLAGIQLIVNVTDQIIIYNFADTAKGGTLATDTLTLEYDTTTMSDTDELMILVEDGVGNATVSTVNSSSTPLGIGGVFTGTSEDTKDYSSIIIATKSDVASATNGLSIQFSTDGTNWDHIDAHTIPAATSHTLTIAPQARYFRIVYTNGGTIQASFRLQAILRSTAVGPQMETLSGDVSDTNFALTTRTVLAAKKPDASYANIQATAGGNLKVSLEEIDSTATLPAGTNAIGRVGHDITGIGDGRKVVTTAGTALALATTTPCKKVTITAETDNTGIIVVGGSTVVAALATRRGTPLNAGDSYEVDIDDLADVYLDTTVSGDGVTFTYFT